MINPTNNQSHNHAHLDTYVRDYLLAFEIETSITPHSVNFFWAICGSKSKTNARPQKYTRKQEASPAKFCVISTISFTYYPKDEMKKLLTCNLQYAITQETPTLRKSKQPLFYQITGPINLQSALSNRTGGTFYKLLRLMRRMLTRFTVLPKLLRTLKSYQECYQRTLTNISILRNAVKKK